MRFAIVFVALTGCRAIVGIEDLTVDASTDAGTTADVRSDTTVTTDAATSDSPSGTDCKTGKTERKQCIECCINAYKAGNDFFYSNAGNNDPCACTSCTQAPASCAASNLCGGATEAKGTPCFGCVMTNTAEGRAECQGLAGRCNGNPACKQWLDCAKTCMPLPPP
jgi:hypothetical protein